MFSLSQMLLDDSSRSFNNGLLEAPELPQGQTDHGKETVMESASNQEMCPAVKGAVPGAKEPSGFTLDKWINLDKGEKHIIGHTFGAGHTVT